MRKKGRILNTSEVIEVVVVVGYHLIAVVMMLMMVPRWLQRADEWKAKEKKTGKKNLLGGGELEGEGEA